MHDILHSPLPASSAWKSSPKTEKQLQLDWTKTAKDLICSLSLSDLRLQDCKKTSLLYLPNNHLLTINNTHPRQFLCILTIITGKKRRVGDWVGWPAAKASHVYTQEVFKNLNVKHLVLQKSYISDSEMKDACIFSISWGSTFHGQSHLSKSFSLDLGLA